jgi:hypothetical protein
VTDDLTTQRSPEEDEFEEDNYEVPNDEVPPDEDDD